MMNDSLKPFMAIPKPVLDSLAGQELRAIDYGVLCRLCCRYNGSNNGQIAASKRDLKRELKAGDDQVLKSLSFLAGLGLIAQSKASRNIPPRRFAAEYRLTWLKSDSNGEPATHEWQKATTASIERLKANLWPSKHANR